MSQPEQSTRPDASAAMQRAILLSNVFLKALATPPPELLAKFTKEEDRAKLAQGCQQLFDKQIEKIRATGLWDLLEDREREFMEAGIFETTMQHRIDASWLAESIMCLFWALGRRDQIPPYDQEVDPRSNWFVKDEKAREMISTATVRQGEEIEKQRDLAELWHWRCRTHMLLTTKKITVALPNGTPMSEIIRVTAGQAAKDGVFPQSISGDFPVFGKPYREVSEEQLSLLTSIAMERHKALNSLCGYAPGNRWSETPTDT
ncbi:MAG: DUF4272 domain-containing protein [Terracidiphilus sp.]